MKTYTLGLLFSPDLKSVVLAVKNGEIPNHKGLLNGVGSECPAPNMNHIHGSMSASFEKDTGHMVEQHWWKNFGFIEHNGAEPYTVHLFACVDPNYQKCKPIEKDDIVIVPVNSALQMETVPDLKYILPAAVDYLQNNNFKFLRIER
jgi:hypothetical protein